VLQPVAVLRVVAFIIGGSQGNVVGQEQVGDGSKAELEAVGVGAAVGVRLGGKAGSDQNDGECEKEEEAAHPVHLVTARRSTQAV